jgi:hypothetical protein
MLQVWISNLPTDGVISIHDGGASGGAELPGFGVMVIVLIARERKLLGSLLAAGAVTVPAGFGST